MSQAPTSAKDRTQSSTTLLIISLGLALTAVVLVNLYIQQVRANVHGDTFTIYRFNRSIAAGEYIRRQDVDEVEVPSDFEDAFKQALNAAALETRINEREELRSPASSGDIVMWHYFAGSGERDDSEIDPGFRKIAVPVNHRSVPAGLQPGMFIDIAAQFPGQGGRPESHWVLERVKVLAVGDVTLAEQESATGRRTTTNYRTIDVQVLPEEALLMSEIEKLALGNNFDILIRNPADEQLRQPEGGINKGVVSLLRRR